MKHHHRKLLLLLIPLFALSIKSQAGLKWVEIGVNGMTCSACTRSVEMSVNRLSFVDSVVMSLENTEGRVYLKTGEQIDLKRIAKAVVNAGFSVRFLRVEFDFTDITINHDGSFAWQGQTYKWFQFKDQLIKEPVTLKLIDEDFLPHKESAQWKKKIGATNNSTDQKVFHVVQEI